MAYADDGKKKGFTTTECTICQLAFNDARLLKCGHEFCKDCIGKWIVNSPRNKTPSSKNGIDCPVCRQVTEPTNKGTNPDNWASQLPCSEHEYDNAEAENSTPETKIKCDPCMSTNKNISATIFCSDCEEYLCLECQLIHKKLKMTRGHSVFEMSVATKASLEITELKNLLHCPKHRDKEFEFYCNDHHDLVCSTCAVVEHRHCNVTETDGQLTSTHLSSLITIENTKCLKKHVMEVINIHVQYEHLLQKDMNDLPLKLEQFHDMINKKINTFKNNVLQNGRRRHAALEKEIKLKTAKCEGIVNRLDAHLKMAENHQHLNVSFPKRFILTRAINNEQELIRADLYVEGNECLPIEFKQLNFQVNEKFTKFLNSDAVGELNETVRVVGDVPVLPKESKSLKDYSLVHVQVLRQNMRTRKNHKPINCQFLDDAHLVIADRSKVLHVIDIADAENETQVRLRYQPWGMAIYQQAKLLALSHPIDKRISIYNLEEDNSISREIKTKYECYGLAICDGDLVVSLCEHFDQWYLTRMDIQGKIKQTLNKDAKGRVFKAIWYFAMDGNSIYQSCGDTDQLYKFDLDNGTPRFQYKHDQLVGPGGIAFDMAKNVFVCGMTSKNVHLITNEGILMKIFSPTHCSVPLVISCSLIGGYLVIIDNQTDSGPHLYQLQIDQ